MKPICFYICEVVGLTIWANKSKCGDVNFIVKQVKTRLVRNYCVIGIKNNI